MKQNHPMAGSPLQCPISCVILSSGAPHLALFEMWGSATITAFKTTRKDLPFRTKPAVYASVVPTLRKVREGWGTLAWEMQAKTKSLPKAGPPAHPPAEYLVTRVDGDYS